MTAPSTTDLITACDRSIAQIDAVIVAMRQLDARARASQSEFETTMARLDAETAKAWKV